MQVNVCEWLPGWKVGLLAEGVPQSATKKGCGPFYISQISVDLTDTSKSDAQTLDGGGKDRRRLVVGVEAVKRSRGFDFVVLLVIAVVSSTLVTFLVMAASRSATPSGQCCPDHATASLRDSAVEDPAVAGVRAAPGPSATGIAALDFFTGGGSYMPRTHCLTTQQGQVDWPWIITLLVLTTGVIVSYLKTFVFWMRSYFDEAPGDRNPKLFELGMVFLLCALCGYAMSIVMFVWPGYRLLAVFLLVLNVFSWKFCANLEPFRQAFASARLRRQLQESVESRARELERLVAERTAEVNRLAEIARRTANAVVITDRHARIEWVNEGFTRITGYSPEEAVGRRPPELVQGPDSDPVEVARMRQAIQKGESVTAELINYHKNGTPYRIRVEIDPLRDESGGLTGFMAIESDVTEQYEYRQELKRRAGELERLRNLAESASQAKSEFLANMSHEIRTPMTAILGYADLLSEDVDGTLSPQDRQEYITTIKRSGQHLLAVINDILDLSKIEAGKLDVERVPTDVDEVLRDLERLMKIKAQEKGILLSIERAPGLPLRILSDPLRLRQVLVNLVGNAIKFTERGEVRVLARFEDIAGASLLRIEVRDTGIGMTGEQLGRLFEAFSQADTSMTRRFGGTGLGLRISRSLAVLLGGDLRVSSEPGKGSLFVLRVAAGRVSEATSSASSSATAADPAPMSSTPAHAPLAGRRILLVEDGLDNQRLVALHLRRAGAEVSIAGNGVQALEMMHRDLTGRPAAPASEGGEAAGTIEFDLVLTDMQMPEMDGYTLARRLREGGWLGPVVALTANAMSGDDHQCIQAGCDAYVPKPIDRSQLVATCGRMLSKARPRPLAA